MDSTIRAPWSVFDPPLVDPESGALFTSARDDLEWFNADRATVDLRAVCGADSQASVVVVYLGGNRFVDLRGMRVLVSATVEARQSGRTLVVLGAPASLRRMVEALGLESRLCLARAVPPQLANGIDAPTAPDPVAPDPVAPDPVAADPIAADPAKRPSRRRPMRSVARLRPWRRLTARRRGGRRADR